MDGIINNGMDISKWMTTGNTILCQKRSGQRKRSRLLSTNIMPSCRVKTNDWNDR